MILAVSCLMFVSSMALAEAPSYSYMGVAYNMSDWDCCDGTYKRWGAGATMEITDHVFVGGVLFQGKQDDAGFDIGGYGVEIGYFSEMGTDATWHTSLGYKRRNIKWEDYDNDRLHSVVWDAGVRKNITETIELNGGVSADYDNDYGTGTHFHIGSVLHISSGLGVELDLSFNADSGSSISTGIRYTF